MKKTSSFWFSENLLRWFDLHGRHNLPWQHPRTAYRVWLSEIMLQQTQVKTVIPYFERFIAAFPTLKDLARANLDEVLGLWSGLGYYARARNLHTAARCCMEYHQGDLPRDLEQLMELPGIGRSTAAAILSQTWGDRAAILDGNVKRVLCRFYGVTGWTGQSQVEKQLWEYAENHLPEQRLADYTQAQMDLGATVCTRSKPQCSECPLSSKCFAYQHQQTDQFPSAKPRKTLPERQVFMLLAKNQSGEILLERRPSVGIWPGLWSLPEINDISEAKTWFNAHLTGRFSQPAALDVFTHTFSHFRLTVQPLAWSAISGQLKLQEIDQSRWFSSSQLLDLGLPAPIRKLLLDY